MMDRSKMAAATALAAALALGACAPGAGGGGADTSLRVAARAAEAGDHGTAATLYRQAFENNPRSTGPGSRETRPTTRY
jgi:hypothetical protein